MKRIVIVAMVLLLSIIVAPAMAQRVDLNDSSTFENHNFAIIKMMFNGTVGTPNSTKLATIEEPLIIVSNNQTIFISLRDWGVDSSRLGVLLNISNNTGASYLMPLQRGWGTQVDEVILDDLRISVGLTEIFRGKSAEFAKFCVVVSKLPKR